MISIKLFMKFSMEIDGQDATQALGNSRKSRRLLEYLILHRGEALSSTELCKMLWPDDEISNPESALKTLVSRTRSALGKYDPLLHKCIITTHGAYRWNMNIPQTVDVFMFETLCLELLQVKEFHGDEEELIETALTLYKGDLGAMSDMGDWIISRNTYYNSLCAKTTRHIIRLMEDKQYYAGIARVTQRGLSVDPLDEDMNLTLMRSFVKLNRRDMALNHYHRVQNMYLNEFGLHLPVSIQNAYKELIRSGQSMDSDIDTVRRTLMQANMASKGAFTCEYAIFQDIYLPLIRNLSRLGEKCCLAVLMISPINTLAEPNSLRTQRAMEKLTVAMGMILRPTDVVARCNPSQTVILLPSLSVQAGQAMLEKIGRAFRKTSKDPEIKLTSKLIPIADEEQYNEVTS